jgi:hypothetical protein
MESEAERERRRLESLDDAEKEKQRLEKERADKLKLETDVSAASLHPKPLFLQEARPNNRAGYGSCCSRKDDQRSRG